MYVISEGDALCDWIYWSHDELRSLGAKIQTPVWQIPPDVPWGGDIKNFQKNNPKTPDIFLSAPVSPLTSTVQTERNCILLLIVSGVE